MNDTADGLRKAFEADVQQYFVQSLTPDRGYDTPIDNLKAFFADQSARIAELERRVEELTEENEKECAVSDELCRQKVELRAEVERLTKERAAYADFLQKAMERIAGLFGVETPLQLIARAKDNEQNYVDILCELITEHLATLQRERDEARAWQAEIRDAIQRSGMGIMRTSQGPSGTMLGYRPEVEEEHERKTLEVIHENVDLAAEVRTLKTQLAEREEDRALLELLRLIVEKDEHFSVVIFGPLGPGDGWRITTQTENFSGESLRAAIRAARAQPEEMP